MNSSPKETSRESLNRSGYEKFAQNDNLPPVDSASITQSGKSTLGFPKLNQDSHVYIKDLFDRMQAYSKEMAYDLYIICDGHGQCGHIVTNYIIEQYPVILKRLLASALDYYRLVELKARNALKP